MNVTVEEVKRDPEGILHRVLDGETLALLPMIDRWPRSGRSSAYVGPAPSAWPRERSSFRTTSMIRYLKMSFETLSNAVLRDAHLFLWYLTGDQRINPFVRTTIENAESVYVSVATLWEATKVSTRQTPLPEPPHPWLSAQREDTM